MQESEELTLWPADSHVSHSALPENEGGSKTRAIYGQKCAELYTKSGPLGLLVKMCLVSSLWASSRCSLIWKTKVTKHNRLLFQLAPSMPRINETESLLWPTPRASEKGDYQYDRGDHSKPRLTLTGAAKMYPTPTAQDAKNATLPPSQINRDSVPGAVMRKMFPTPHVNCYTGAGKRGDGTPNLQKAIMFPSPVASGKLNGGTGDFQKLQKMKETGQITEEERRAMSAGNGGTLNPEFVEWLMGFPIGHTDLEPSETP